MRHGIGIGRHADDLLRKRIDDVVSKSSRNAGFAAGEWLDPDVRLPVESAHRSPLESLRIDRALDRADDCLSGSYETLRQHVRTTDRPDSDTGPLDELLREIDRREGVADAADSVISAVDRNSMTVPRGLQSDIDEMSWRPAPEPLAGIGLAAISSIAPSELPLRMLRADRLPEGAGEPVSGDFAGRESNGQNESFGTIAKRLDELAREVHQRETAATDDEISAFKQRLTTLARETEIAVEHRLLDGVRVADSQSDPAGREFEHWRPSEPVADSGYRPQLPELHGYRHDHSSDEGRPRGDAPATSNWADAIESDLSMILNSVAQQSRINSQDQKFEVGTSEAAETPALKRDELVAVASERWPSCSDRATEERAAVGHSDSQPVCDPPVAPARGSADTGSKRPSRSTMVPILRAGLAAVLAIAIVVPGAYFARSRMSATATAPAVTIVHERAPVREPVDTGPLTIMPANTVARFQDLIFQLPRLYGIYAINSGRLFELDALPGQAPDPRIAVSAAIPRPSHTTLPDGRVAFLLFRRDMAAHISERVPVRVVAKMRRTMTDMAEHGASLQDAWTIRNIAIDFRVAPVDHNKEMVLLVPEKSDFTFPAGRYALILKGQAYDFAIAGPVTDPAQCLERVEAANGSFFHECQSSPAPTAELSSQDGQASVQQPPSKSRRSNELHARAEGRASKGQTLR